MYEDSVRRRTQLTLHNARMQTALGQAVQSAEFVIPDPTNPEGMAALLSYITVSIEALNRVVTDLATEIDNLRGT
jgi:hypothetical protein